MKKWMTVSLFCLFVQLGFSQQYDPLNIKKKAVEYYTKAQERMVDNNIVSAIGLLIQAVQTDNRYIDAHLALASLYGQIKNHSKSVEQYEISFSLDSNYTLLYKSPYAFQLAALGQFDKALAAVNELLSKKHITNSSLLNKLEERKKSFQFAVDFEKNHPDKNYVFAPQNVGSGVNTADPEYFPSLSLDAQQLVFTRRVNNYNEDFYTSQLTDKGWAIASPLKGNINTPGNEAAQTISQDGELLIFTARDRRDSYGNYDLYYSVMTPKGWSDAVNLGGNVNSDQWDSQPCLSPDKRDLYFASKRIGGLGGSDIYVCHLLPNGKWGPAENLGPGINTKGDDQCPFIHVDNQTLYFTSNGWPGYGENDLFYVRRSVGHSWTQPMNLGYPINTVNDEGTLFIAADGVTAYYASDRSDSKGSLDIYSFQLRKDIRPFKTLWVKGIVTDKKTQQPLPSTVQLIDLATEEIITEVQTDVNGKYLITLPVGKDYAFTVDHKGYLFYSDNFLMLNKSPDSTYQKNIALQPIELNATIVLKNIFFDVNQYELKPESKVELDKLVQLLNENPTMKIEISGYTDNVGQAADNKILSVNRAKAVVTYLVEKNIAAGRLTAKGFGETNPIADNNTEEGRAKNRRTEMKIISH
ncbi:MAG: OmpA family protein [Chitinophagaceae bacterium]